MPQNDLPLFDYAARSRPATSKPCRLMEDPGRGSRIRKAWEAFHQANPQVFQAIWREADRQFRGHRKRISMKMIFEILRADPTLATDGKPFKLNNNFTSYYARELIRQYPAFDGLLELRDQGG